MKISKAALVLFLMLSATGCMKSISALYDFDDRRENSVSLIDDSDFYFVYKIDSDSFNTIRIRHVVFPPGIHKITFVGPSLVAGGGKSLSRKFSHKYNFERGATYVVQTVDLAGLQIVNQDTKEILSAIE